MRKPKKLVLIGIDNYTPTVVEKLVKEGALKNMARIMEEGCYTRALPHWSAETGTNWATIATGAFPATHGCQMGVPLDSFSSEVCRAEQIWQVAEDEGKVSVIFDYPASLPLNVKNVIHVGEDGAPGPSSLQEVATARGYATTDADQGLLESAEDVFDHYRARRSAADSVWERRALTRIELSRAEGWKNLPPGTDALEAAIRTVPGVRAIRRAEAELYLLVLKGRDGGYSEVALFPTKDYSRPLGRAELGKWSGWMVHTFGDVRAAFRMKLLRLSPDGSDLHLYLSQIYPLEGFTHPPELAGRLIEECGYYLHRPTVQWLVYGGACDGETFTEELAYQAEWYARAAAYVLEHYDWDLFIMKWHGPDFLQHLYWGTIDPVHPLYDPDGADESWEYFRRFYGYADDLVGAILDHVGDDALVGVVSDHGEVSHTFWPHPESLEREGLVVRGEDGSPDPSRSKVHFSHAGVWINLKGRDPNSLLSMIMGPEGTVEPEEYEELRDKVIGLLLEERHPITGRPIFSFVCKREEAGFLGYGGDRAADIVFGLRPDAAAGISREDYERMRERHPLPNTPAGTHGPYLPSCRFGMGTMEALFALKGPGVRRGYRRRQPIWLSDVVPTMCHIVGWRWPKDADGKVAVDFLER